MTTRTMSPFHTVEEEWLAAYAAGGLSDFKRLLIACQAAVEPRLNGMLDALDAVGGAFLEAAKGDDLSGGFFDRVMDALGPQDRAGETPAPREDGGWMPSPLQRFLADSAISVDWRKVGPGVERATLASDDGERLYLLKAQPGLKVPMHSHCGEEWTLLLSGAYHVGEAGYRRGDLHREDESCTHQPVIDAGEVCISLVADEGRLKFTDPLLRLIQPMIGI